MNENNPRFMICDVLPSEMEEYQLEYVLDTHYGVLFGFDDGGNGQVCAWLSEPIKDLTLLTQANREAGEWYVKYMEEVEKYDG